MRYEVNNVIVPVEKNQDKAIMFQLKKMGIEKYNVKGIDYLKRSIDSRKKGNIKFIYKLLVTTNKHMDIKNSQIKEYKQLENVKREPVKLKGEVAVIGTGPAGLFAALRLAEYGLKPLLFEQGEKVENRAKTVNNFFENAKLNKNSNIQFGEGGAGTFSDGKLTTRIKSEYIDKVFKTFVENGAKKDILYDYKPHIGTDILQEVVKNMRKKIIALGGKVYFNSKLTDINIKNGKVKSIEINRDEKIDVEYLILAIGHSARDTYEMLNKNGVYLENKDFAIGVRIEHPRGIIDQMQYGKFANNPNLGAATYNFTYNNRNENRGAFTFCMCPGGEIVNSASELGSSLVNGMSYSTRDGAFSNSAVVVGITEKDYGKNLFDGIKLQRKIERKTYKEVGNYGAVYQNLIDFLENKETNKNIESSFKMELKSYKMDNLLPKYVSKNLKKAFNYWSKNRYFISDKANLIGAETRTSSPVRIKRDEKSRAINIENLFPIGEGAGYAGGIVSAAVDGIKVVDINFTKVK
ncbi:NAD(P)/FAD-dependent oxidoreductase [Haliovirga abyssi]|uniref:NAD(FAD)-utilizing dehydrogenase n=1 Tax=Haliovirga abyssi TaxID=2996794 RepID=A0AAU9DLC3_9FUSO|nr:FAD-dependent oxidoreductase [Haliovirga abyssi]BDU50742.1 NAD(FAD)-utilizing dehydrogenase [Haliovirga abyssi]